MPSDVAANVQPIPRNLKREFEKAVREIYDAGLPGKAAKKRPIFQRSRVAAETGIMAEKRALADAAKALAQIWKISPKSTR